MRWLFSACLGVALIGYIGTAEAGPCRNTPPVARTPSTGSPFATKDVTLMETQTSDNVSINGGCVDAVINGQLYPANAYRGVISKARHKWNGQTDDNVADSSQGAINAASAAGGGIVTIPAGTYYISTTIALPSNVILRGAGWGSGTCSTKLIWNGAASGVMVQVGDDTTSTIQAAGLANLCLDGAGVAATGLKLRSSQFGEFASLLIQGVTANAIDVDTGTVAQAGNAHNHFKEIRISLGHANSVNANGWYIGPATLTTDYHNNVHEGINIGTQAGHGIVCGNADFNTWTKVSASSVGVGGGRPLVLKGSNTSVVNTCRHNAWYLAALGDGDSGATLAEATGLTYPSVDNWILPFVKGGGQPNPVLEDGATLFCMTTAGDMCDGTTPWGNLKFSPRFRSINSDYTVTTSDCGIHFAMGSASDRTFTLPAATGSACTLEFTKLGSGKFTVATAGTDRVSTAGSSSTTAAGGTIFTELLYSTVRIQDQESGRWVAKDVVGSWVTSSGGGVAAGGLMRIGTVNASTSSTIPFTGIPAGFGTVQLECSNLLPGADAVNLMLQVGTGATPTWQNANYSYTMTGRNTAGAITAADSTADTGIQLNAGDAINLDAANTVSFTARIRNISSTTSNKNVEFQSSYNNNTPVYESVAGAGKWTGAQDAITSVRVFFELGGGAASTVTSGQCSLFGLVP